MERTRLDSYLLRAAEMPADFVADISEDTYEKYFADHERKFRPKGFFIRLGKMASIFFARLQGDSGTEVYEVSERSLKIRGKLAAGVMAAVATSLLIEACQPAQHDKDRAQPAPIVVSGETEDAPNDCIAALPKEVPVLTLGQYIGYCSSVEAPESE